MYFEIEFVLVGIRPKKEGLNNLTFEVIPNTLQNLSDINEDSISIMAQEEASKVIVMKSTEGSENIINFSEPGENLQDATMNFETLLARNSNINENGIIRVQLENDQEIVNIPIIESDPLSN